MSWKLKNYVSGLVAGLRKLCRVIRPHLPKNWGLFLSIAFASTFIADYLIPGQAKHFNVLIGASVGWLLDALIAIREKGATALNELDSLLRQTHQGAELAEQYYHIASKRFSVELETELRSLLDARHEFKGEFLAKATELAKQWKGRVDANERWRILMQILLCSELNSVKANDFSMPLRTYLRMLLTTTDLAVAAAEAKRQKLVIASFTNACASDWFRQSNPVVGESMEHYADELSSRIATMRSSGYSYRRHILCSQTLTNRGFRTCAEVEEDWSSCTPKEKAVYLSALHSSEDDAHIVDLYPELDFQGKFTELIYFGFEESGTIHWDWCYACAYTRDNKNVSAKFVNLDRDGFELLIHVPNKAHRHLGSSLAVPAEIKVTIKEFPNCFTELGRGFKIKNLVPLARKWHLAAQIWHGQHEAEIVRKLFVDRLPARAAVLDCACGTGFHAFLLHRAGFSVAATDADAGNIELLIEAQVTAGIQFEARQLGWLDLEGTFKGKFDCVACLGSSITYYESWNEQTRELGNAATVEDVLKQFRSVLKQGGKLVLGISRYYDKDLDGASVLFRPKVIDDRTYTMEWTLRYDWQKMRKTWDCRIVEQPHGDDYSFFLVSHLINRDDLIRICRNVFSTVEVVDLDSSFYDIFFICTA